MISILTKLCTVHNMYNQIIKNLLKLVLERSNVEFRYIKLYLPHLGTQQCIMKKINPQNVRNQCRQSSYSHKLCAWYAHVGKNKMICSNYMANQGEFM